MIGVFFLGGGGRAGGGVGQTPDAFNSQVGCRSLKLKYLSAFVLSCHILPEIPAVCNKGGYYRNVFMYSPDFQASGEC